MVTLDSDLRDMIDRPLSDNFEYFAITLLADDELNPFVEVCTLWTGIDANRRFEVREGRVVSAAYGEIWTSINQPYVFVTTEAHFNAFILWGGRALIERCLCQQKRPEWVAPSEVYQKGGGGLISKVDIDKIALNRSPTRKVRFDILKRDGLKCRVCGRRPSDYVDLELHVHHIRPWGKGGLTLPSNLLTLCQTCHGGLDPHYEYSLFDLIKEDELSNFCYIREVDNYRNMVTDQLAKMTIDAD